MFQKYFLSSREIDSAKLFLRIIFQTRGKMLWGVFLMNSLGIFENGEGVFPILAPALEKYGGAAFKTDFSLDGRIYPLIICKKQRPSADFFKNRFTAVAGEKDIYLLELLKKQKIKVLTCGLCEKNSLTLSSFEAGEASVCLTRQYRKLLPCEFTVRFPDSLSAEQLLLCAAGLLLTVGYKEEFSL